MSITKLVLVSKTAGTSKSWVVMLILINKHSQSYETVLTLNSNKIAKSSLRHTTSGISQRETMRLFIDSFYCVTTTTKNERSAIGDSLISLLVVYCLSKY